MSCTVAEVEKSGLGLARTQSYHQPLAINNLCLNAHLFLVALEAVEQGTELLKDLEVPLSGSHPERSIMAVLGILAQQCRCSPS